MTASDISALRALIKARGDTSLWRSLDALEGSPEFQHFVKTEFSAASRLAQRPDRRRFFKLMAASFALAGLVGCDDEDTRDHEVPYVRNPEHRRPGERLSFATASILGGFADGMLATTVNGRPIKIEGNPEHPWSRGGTDIFAQASVLGLYDPYRSQAVLNFGRPSSWQAFQGVAKHAFAAERARGGKGLRVLTGPVTSPSFAAQMAGLRAEFPDMTWHSHAPAGRAQMAAGTAEAFGRPADIHWRFERAQLVVSLGGDFLDAGPQQIGAARRWADARKASVKTGRLLALHSAAATPNLTSAKADHHAVLDPADLAALAHGLLEDAGGAPSGAGPAASWRSRVSRELAASRGRSIVVAGSQMPAAEHAVVHRINAALGNFGETMFATEPVQVQAQTLETLVQAMRAGDVSVLLILDGNPAYTAPADLGFADALQRVPLKIHAGLYADESAACSDWHLPLSHPLESWGDAASVDGTATLLQPTIAPLYGGRSAAEILALLTEDTPRDGRALLEEHWKGARGLSAETWHEALRAGFVADTASPAIETRISAPTPPAPAAAPGLTVLLRADPAIWDGSFANNSWLQELPKPLSKIVWENAILVSPRLAEREHLETGDIVRLAIGGAFIEGPVWLQPGQAENTVTVTLGYGRSAADLLATGLGHDAYKLAASAEPGQRGGASLARTGRRAKPASTQDHGTMQGEDFVRVQRLGDAPHAPIAAAASTKVSGHDEDQRAWGMVIDLDSCIGCNACVVACQAENNIAVVGREEVALGREMHWLRVDRYHSGNLDDPDTHFQPVPCMHCEEAPCEAGCPVEATLHDHEGLNLMVYNRCVGTRACSGYCPYKVRRFNYLDYSGGAAPSLQQQRNPDVTVRAGGVMEKCTYCVQRIAAARIVSDRDDAPIADGVVQTACQGACPTRAIVFGDLHDPGSEIAMKRADGRNYALLGELGLKPRTTYLAKLAAEGGA